MTEAVLGTFSDCKIIKTRSVLQIIVEIPIEQADEALKALGGIPQPGTERWIGVALAPKEREVISKVLGDVVEIQNAVREKKKFAEMPLSQQAGIRSNDSQFQDFICVTFGREGLDFIDSEGAANLIRAYCVVGSRSELDANEIAGAKWKKLEADYQAYLTDLRYAGSPGL